MPPKTVASLLAQQPDDDLMEMRDSIHAEIARLQIELELVDQALRRRPRARRGGLTGVGDNGTRMSGVKRADVLRIVQELGGEVAPVDVRRQLEFRGVSISGAAVRNHLRRLVRDGELETSGEGAYFLPRTHTEPAQGGLDIL